MCCVGLQGNTRAFPSSLPRTPSRSDRQKQVRAGTTPTDLQQAGRKTKPNSPSQPSQSPCFLTRNPFRLTNQIPHTPANPKPHHLAKFETRISGKTRDPTAQNPRPAIDRPADL